MKNLVFKGENNQALTNSLLVAEKFGKEHQHVLRDIRNLVEGVSKIGDTPMFVESSYIHPQNSQEYPLFIMNRDGFTLLAMGFTGDKALQFKLDYINTFNKMEEAIKSGGFHIPSSFSEALMLAARKAEELEKAAKQISMLTPKADFADKAFDTDGKVDIGQAAKILNLGYGRNTLFKRLRKEGVFFANRNEPKQRFVDAGYFELKEQLIPRENHPSFTVMKVFVTQKGLAYINLILGGKKSDGKLLTIT